MAQTLRVVDILVTGKASEHRLPQQTNQSMAAIPPGARIGEHITSYCAETESIVEFAIGEQPSIGGNYRAMELKLQAAVKIEPESAIIRFTRRVLHDGLMWFRLNY